MSKRTELWAEPYRAFFLFGALYAVTILCFWGYHLYTIGLGAAPFIPALEPTRHAHLMIWGIWGSYVYGFSLTAYPKQNNGAPLSAGKLQGLFALWVLSQGALVVGWFAEISPLAAAGKAGELAGYVFLLSYLFPIGIRQLRREFWWQPLAVLIALSTGTLALGFASFAPLAAVWPATHGALWGYFVFLIAAFAYRVVPFFTSRVVPGYEIQRGRFFLPVLLVLLWLAPAARQSLGDKAFDVANGLIFLWALREWLRWAPLRGMRVPLIGVLHLGWLWLLAALFVAAFAWSSKWTRFDAFNHTHMLTVGFLVTFILGISTRVTLGHGGYPLKFGVAGGLVIVIAQVAAILRVFGLVIFPGVNPPQLFAVSAFTLAGALLLWLVRFGPCLILPKVPPQKACPK